MSCLCGIAYLWSVRAAHNKKLLPKKLQILLDQVPFFLQSPIPLHFFSRKNKFNVCLLWPVSINKFIMLSPRSPTKVCLLPLRWTCGVGSFEKVPVQVGFSPAIQPYNHPTVQLAIHPACCFSFSNESEHSCVH